MATGSAIRPAGRLARLPLQSISGGLTITLLRVAWLSILLAAAETFALSTGQSTTLIVVVHALTALLTSGLTLAFRLPVFAGINITGFLFVVSLAGTYSYQEAMGGVLAAGVLVVLVAVLGLSERLTALVPAPIVFGTVAGAILPLVLTIFTGLAEEPAVIGVTVLAFVLSRRLLSARIPAILPALGAGILVALFSDKLNGASDPWAFPTLTTEGPVFSWQAIVAIAPVVAIMISANANLAAIVYMRSQGYHPPERRLQAATGAGTMLGALFGAIPISMGAFVAPLVAGPEAGERHQRPWAAYATAAGMVVIVLFAGVAAQIPEMIPTSLLLAVSGLVLVSVLGQTLGDAISGPLKLGPLFAFVAAASNMSLWGFGSAFWALVIGMVVTMLLEPRELATTHQSP